MRKTNQNALSIAMFAVSILLAGCAGSPARLSMMDADELAQQSDIALCNAFARNGNTHAYTVVADRHPEITDEEWVRINHHEIWVGMTELQLVCSMGWPIPGGTINRSGGAYGERAQWVYRPYLCDYCKASYVYTEDGHVTNWQF